MYPISWKSYFSVGIDKLDLQHKHLIKLINATYEEFANDAHSRDIIKILFKLTTYAKKHCIFEESIMKKYNFPNIEIHNIAHEHILNGLEKMLEILETGKSDFSFQQLILLQSWFLSHMLDIDAEMGQFILAKKIHPKA